MTGEVFARAHRRCVQNFTVGIEKTAWTFAGHFGGFNVNQPVAIYIRNTRLFKLQVACRARARRQGGSSRSPTSSLNEIFDSNATPPTSLTPSSSMPSMCPTLSLLPALLWQSQALSRRFQVLNRRQRCWCPRLHYFHSWNLAERGESRRPGERDASRP